MNSNQLILIGLGFALIILVPLLLRIFTNLLVPSSDNTYRYRKQNALFSSAERSFLGILDQAVGDQYRILGKVRIADVITPEKGMNRRHWQIAFNRISAKHFDYLLCDKHTLEVIAAIELDDKSHKQTRTQQRDLLIEQACESAKLPLIRFDAKRSYQLELIRSTIHTALPAKTHAAEESSLILTTSKT